MSATPEVINNNNIDTNKNPNQKPGFAARKQKTISGMEEKVVNIKSINKTTKGGRRQRFSVLAVIGDRNGKVGFGIGKSVEVPVAIQKAIKDAQKNIFNVQISKTGTVFHDFVGKKCASKVLIKPAKVGTGIIAGSVIRAVLELAGYKNIYSKNLGASSALNMIRATINALTNQHNPSNIAKLRNKSVSEL
ncbi:MAG: 30S ribosomal protein S5 [Mycoplasmataceae bacterium]|jgi:small subunit ribosomal protein S5|nr:30S ribosomal protein S5 [Mycoplasmataceae bacterium]